MERIPRTKSLLFRARNVGGVLHEQHAGGRLQNRKRVGDHPHEPRAGRYPNDAARRAVIRSFGATTLALYLPTIPTALAQSVTPPNAGAAPRAPQPSTAQSSAAQSSTAQSSARSASFHSWPLQTPQRTGIHDVAPAPDGGVWFSAQRSGHLGWFDPKTGRTELVALGERSSPHGVIQGPDGAAWLTDSGQNAIVRVGWPERAVRVFPLPEGTPYANLNTAAFDAQGTLWFTGQSGFVGRVDPKTGETKVWRAPRGRGPYGICATPEGEIWWCSLAGSFIARIDRDTGDSQVVEPPTKDQGARRVWSDSRGRIWVSEWNSGNLSVHDPVDGSWRAWKLPGDAPRAYAVYVDERDIAWVSDFGGNAVFLFDPQTERFERFAFPREGAAVRQILGRPGEIWLPESGTEQISVIRTG